MWEPKDTIFSVVLTYFMATRLCVSRLQAAGRAGKVASTHKADKRTTGLSQASSTIRPSVRIITTPPEVRLWPLRLQPGSRTRETQTTIHSRFQQNVVPAIWLCL